MEDETTFNFIDRFQDFTLPYTAFVVIQQNNIICSSSKLRDSNYLQNVRYQGKKIDKLQFEYDVLTNQQLFDLALNMFKTSRV